MIKMHSERNESTNPVFTWNPSDEQARTPVTTFLQQIEKALVHPEFIKTLILIDAPINPQTIQAVLQLIKKCPIKTFNTKETSLSADIYKKLHFALLKHSHITSVRGFELTEQLTRHLEHNKRLNNAKITLESGLEKMQQYLDTPRITDTKPSPEVKGVEIESNVAIYPQSQSETNSQSHELDKRKYYKLIDHYKSLLGREERQTYLCRFFEIWLKLCIKLELSEDVLKYIKRIEQYPFYTKTEKGQEKLKKLYESVGNYFFAQAGNTSQEATEKLKNLDLGHKYLLLANSRLAKLVKPILGAAYSEMGESINQSLDSQTFPYKKSSVLQFSVKANEAASDSGADCDEQSSTNKLGCSKM